MQGEPRMASPSEGQAGWSPVSLASSKGKYVRLMEVVKGWDGSRVRGCGQRKLA